MAARRPDPLASLARLRRLETGGARRRLAEDSGRLLAAEHRAEAAGAALRTEAVAAAACPEDYAAWLGRGIAERDRAALVVAAAAKRAEEGRAALAEARVAERCIEQLVLERAFVAEARARKAEQAAVDDAAGRRAHADRGG
jgi:hypothetical protein